MRKLALAVFLFALPSLPALAKEVAGVNLPDVAQVDGQNLALNGAGLRKKFMFKVYVIGLYTAQPSHDAKTLVASDQPKFVKLKLLRNVEKDKIVDAIREGFEHNSKSQMQALNTRLLQMSVAIPDLKEGDELTFTMSGGSTKMGGVAKPVTLQGKDFADALLNVWLGQDPVDDDLKAALLGRSG
jgi:hypothetical protein